ncbi:hypothetical protein [Streptomyces sp. Ac-502]|uniref:hypothetical protein n=1 Tax=Streptomyces sp. Ac-502 TaxID=3342801 RepID=UPI0038625E1B
MPGAGHPGPSKPSAAAVDALDDLNVKRAEFDDAEARLGELDMDPHAIRQQIDDANDAIAVERLQRGEYVGPLGGAPAPHGGDPLPVGPHDWSPDPRAPRALWPEPGTHAAGRTMVNQSFRDMPFAGHQPLTGGDYLSWMRASTGRAGRCPTWSTPSSRTARSAAASSRTSSTRSPAAWRATTAASAW